MPLSALSHWHSFPLSLLVHILVPHGHILRHRLSPIFLSFSSNLQALHDWLPKILHSSKDKLIRQSISLIIIKRQTMGELKELRGERLKEGAYFPPLYYFLTPIINSLPHRSSLLSYYWLSLIHSHSPFPYQPFVASLLSIFLAGWNDGRILAEKERHLASFERGSQWTPLIFP